ncbi:molybdopterin molybdotransferase MoeA [Sphingomonas alba]|uniref:Molybdopterin molybdenumtransferase n=1 Tax=Sphingomonas alba TaxID=2908208 RepID=A0ABT0RNB5_9SPHN|nr:molybdopterin molybdotransferase MoeA [Sphingomonas alba]MCL6684123.1 molybdopterin molybdotransferase MoeA [Sphingomonas alba]
MISFEEAVALVKGAAVPLGTETIGLDTAAGRVLAEPIVARLDSPRSDVSAMDGYALRDADLDQLPVELHVVGESFAGRSWNGEFGPGECVRIFTGAPVPAGADRVVIQENVRRDGEVATIEAHPGHARHIRTQGSDFRRGSELISAGRLLDPLAVVCAAAADVDSLVVHRVPRMRILSTGDELAEPGSACNRDDAIPESVSFGIAALARQWGGEVVGRSRLRDDLEEMERSAAEALVDTDLVVVTGGASVGEKDFAKTMFGPAGLELIFSNVAIKPGKPVWLGRAGKTLVLGLPGNPTSALVTGRLLLAPLLAGLCGREPDEALNWRNASLASDLSECGPRETFHRGRSVGERVELLSNQDSSAQMTLAQADLLVRQRAAAPALTTGEPVQVLDF